MWNDFPNLLGSYRKRNRFRIPHNSLWAVSTIQILSVVDLVFLEAVLVYHHQHHIVLRGKFRWFCYAINYRYIFCYGFFSYCDRRWGGCESIAIRACFSVKHESISWRHWDRCDVVKLVSSRLGEDQTWSVRLIWRWIRLSPGSGSQTWKVGKYDYRVFKKMAGSCIRGSYDRHLVGADQP